LRLVRCLRGSCLSVRAGLTVAVTATVAFFTRINPIWIFVGAGVLGLSAWL